MNMKKEAGILDSLFDICMGCNFSNSFLLHLGIAYMFTGLVDFPGKLVVIDLQAIDVRAPSGARFCIMDGIFNFGVGSPE